MSLAVRALETIRRHGLARPGDRVLVGLSGGADSVGLLLVMRELEAQGAIRLAGVAHLHHRLRGAAADEDEAFCAALSGRLGVPFLSERIDVAALARAQKRSIEDAARVARYAFFARAAGELGADAVAVAHTRDDQAETFLLRLIRGAGTRGLGAIRPRAGRVIRPLLDVERAEVRAYLAARGEAFREDATNADVAFARNRVRHELIPYLQSHFSAGVTDVLAREAALAQQDEEFLHDEAVKLASRIVLSDTATGKDAVASAGADSAPAYGTAVRAGGSLRLDVEGLKGAPRALSSRVAQAALQSMAGSRPIHFAHVDRLLALLDDDGCEGRALSFPGQSVVRVGGTILLRPARSRKRVEANSFAFSLSIPGEVRLGPQGLAVAAQSMPGTPGAGERPRQWAARGAEVGVAAQAIELPLVVRSRRPGDRFWPLGAPGRRKLQDFFVDRKVAREDRDTVPLVVDGRDRIVWVVGHSVAEDFRITEPSQAVILLQVRHLGGVG